MIDHDPWISMSLSFTLKYTYITNHSNDHDPWISTSLSLSLSLSLSNTHIIMHVLCYHRAIRKMEEPFTFRNQKGMEMAYLPGGERERKAKQNKRMLIK